MCLKEKIVLFKSEAKLKEGVFIDLKIRKLLLDDRFIDKLNSTELNDWKLYKRVVNNFLEKYKAENFAKIVENLLQPYQRFCCRLTIFPSCSSRLFSNELKSS